MTTCPATGCTVIKSLLSSAVIGESNIVLFVKKILLLCLYRKLCYAFSITLNILFILVYYFIFLININKLIKPALKNISQSFKYINVFDPLLILYAF